MRVLVLMITMQSPHSKAVSVWYHVAIDVELYRHVKRSQTHTHTYTNQNIMEYTDHFGKSLNVFDLTFTTPSR